MSLQNRLRRLKLWLLFESLDSVVKIVLRRSNFNISSTRFLRNSKLVATWWLLITVIGSLHSDAAFACLVHHCLNMNVLSSLNRRFTLLLLNKVCFLVLELVWRCILRTGLRISYRLILVTQGFLSHHCLLGGCWHHVVASWDSRLLIVRF